MEAILKKIPFFARLSDSEIAAIVARVKMEYYPAAYTVFKEGDPGQVMYVIKRGQVEVKRGNATVATLADNDFFGELALVSDEARNATVTTATDVELLTLSKDDFRNLLTSNPELASAVSYAAVKRVSH